jgi:hypothetical protein
MVRLRVNRRDVLVGTPVAQGKRSVQRGPRDPDADDMVHAGPGFGHFGG